MYKKILLMSSYVQKIITYVQLCTKNYYFIKRQVYFIVALEKVMTLENILK